MRKSHHEITICQEKIRVEHGDIGSQLQVIQPNCKKEGPEHELTVKCEHDEDSPMNLVKEKKLNSTTPEFKKSLTLCHDYESPEDLKKYNDKYLANANKSLEDGHTLNPDLIMTESTGRSSSLQVSTATNLLIPYSENSTESNINTSNCKKSIGHQLTSKSETNHTSYGELSSTDVPNVGGMLAKQLVSPLRNNYNLHVHTEDRNIKEDDSCMILRASSSKLALSTSHPSPSSITSSPLCTAANANILSYTRSQSKNKDSSASSSSLYSITPSVDDLGTKPSTAVVSMAASNITNATLNLTNDEKFIPPDSNIILISEPQMRRFETAGRFPLQLIVSIEIVLILNCRLC